MAGQRGGAVRGSGASQVQDDLVIGDDLTVTQGPIILGDGSGSVELRLSKSDAGTAVINFYSNGILRGQITCDANENFVIQPPAHTSSATGSTTAIRGGIPGAAEGAGGPLNLQGADGVTSSAAARAGGAVNITAGSGVSGGAYGSVALRANNTTNVTVGYNGSAPTLGFYGGGAVVQPTDISALTNNTGVTPDNTIENVPAATAASVDTSAASLTSTNASLTALENNDSDLADQINDIRTRLRALGLMA